MVATKDANVLSLGDVERLLNLHPQEGRSLSTTLPLLPLTDAEHQGLQQLQNNFRAYYRDGKILEGQIQFLFVSPLLWLSGYHAPPIRVGLEVGVADIEVLDADILIKGRMDILAAKRVQETAEIPVLWVLLIESKNSSIDASEGLPQLLSYAYTGLTQQPGVWGMTTNGMDYQFVYLQQAHSPTVPQTYTLFPKLSLMYSEQSIQLLQVLKAILTTAQFTPTQSLPG
jgi:hypothetical protein